MRSVVKAQSFAALDKLPHTWVVAEDEISFKQELRSSKLDEACYILDKNKPKKDLPFSPVVAHQITDVQDCWSSCAE